MKKILFPISLGNNSFSTENVITGIKAIPEKYDEIIYIIADQIQLYNRVMNVHDGDGLAYLIKKFRSGKKLFEERSIWLDKIKNINQFNSSGIQNWTIYGFEDITDQTFNKIYRNILIMYNSIPEFQIDVNTDARKFIIKRSQKKDYSESDVNLSVYYILEEIAASIRLHVCEEIYSEYYLGEHLNCILKLYSSQYGIDVFSIANTEYKNISWNFFDFSLELGSWSENRIYNSPMAIV